MGEDGRPDLVNRDPNSLNDSLSVSNASRKTTASAATLTLISNSFQLGACNKALSQTACLDMSGLISWRPKSSRYGWIFF